MRALHYGSDCHGEWLAAIHALVYARPGALALQLGDPVSGDAAAWAVGAGWPKDSFQMLASGVVIVEDRIAKVDFFRYHDRNLEN